MNLAKRENWEPRDRSLIPGFEAWCANRHSAALGVFDKALKKDPENAEAYRGRGSVLWSLKDFNGSLSAFQQSVRYDCWNAMHWANVGLALRELNRRSQAVNVFKVAVSLDATYVPAYNEWANVLFDDRRYDKALGLYDKTLSLDSSRAVYHHNRGMCRRALNDISGALESFYSALALDPSYYYTRLELHHLWQSFSKRPLHLFPKH